MSKKKAPGKHYREGISLLELSQMFPNEKAARDWFENILWAGGKNRVCPQCESDNTYACKHKTMPYRCRDCGKYFSVKTGTLMQDSPIPMLKWIYAIYLDVCSLKGVSSMKLRRDLKITQKTAWFMQQRIREAFKQEGPNVMFGPAEVDESYFGGKEGNKHKSKRLNAGRGTVGKTAVVGIKDRATNEINAEVIENTDAKTLQGFVGEHVIEGTTVITDDAPAYKGMKMNHKVVKHSVGEYVKEQAHINGIESFWATLKRAHKGTFHKLSAKHLQRYVNEFAGRHNIRELDTIEQMVLISSRFSNKHLPYAELIAENGLDRVATEA
ncbi:MAG: IS1595 family transposase [Gammaproteobacteria bacterium]|nr:IS1595 family transposase [Gammaproteobacteria bacterium]